MKKITINMIAGLTLTTNLVFSKWVDEVPNYNDFKSLIHAIESYGNNIGYLDKKLFYNRNGKPLNYRGKHQIGEALIKDIFKKYPNETKDIKVNWGKVDKITPDNNWVTKENQDKLFSLAIRMIKEDFNKGVFKEFGVKPTVLHMWTYWNQGRRALKVALTLPLTNYNIDATSFQNRIKNNMPSRGSLSSSPVGEKYPFDGMTGYMSAWSEVIEAWHNRQLDNVSLGYDSSKLVKDDRDVFPFKEAKWEEFFSFVKATVGKNSDDFRSAELFFNKKGEELPCKGICQFSENVLYDTIEHFKNNVETIDGMSIRISDITVDFRQGNALTNSNNWVDPKVQKLLTKLRYRWIVSILMKDGIKPSTINIWTAWHLGLDALRYQLTGTTKWSEYNDEKYEKLVSDKMPFEGMFKDSYTYYATDKFHLDEISYQLAWAKVMENWKQLTLKTNKPVVLKKVELPSKFKSKHGRNMNRLKGVQSDLIKICNYMDKHSKIDFMVVTGYRNPAEQLKKVEQGYSMALWWGRHLTNLAIDIVPVVNGKPVFERRNSRERKHWSKLHKEFWRAKKALKIKSKMSNLGKSIQDWAHFQIDVLNGKRVSSKVSKKQFFKYVSKHMKRSRIIKAMSKLNKRRRHKKKGNRSPISYKGLL